MFLKIILDFLNAYSDVIQILVSIVSVGIAIYVPFNIANREKKLTLFEKRVSTYMELSQIFYNNPFVNYVGFIKGYANVNDENAGISVDYYSKEIKKILTEASFLFSDKVRDKIHIILENRFQLNGIVDLTERGTTCFSKKDVSAFKRLLQSIDNSPTRTNDESQLKEISKKYSFKSEDFYDVSDSIEYDVLSLLDKEKRLIKETSVLQEELINDIKKEIHL